MPRNNNSHRSGKNLGSGGPTQRKLQRFDDFMKWLVDNPTPVGENAPRQRRIHRRS